MVWWEWGKVGELWTLEGQWSGARWPGVDAPQPAGKCGEKMDFSAESFHCPGQTSVTLDTVKRHLHICAKLVKVLLMLVHSELMNTQVDNIQSFSSTSGKANQLSLGKRFFPQRKAITEVGSLVVVFFLWNSYCEKVWFLSSLHCFPHRAITWQLRINLREPLENYNGFHQFLYDFFWEGWRVM